MPRRSFDEAFQLAAVKLVTEEEFSVKEVSLQVEVHATSLYRWAQEVEKHGEIASLRKGRALFDTYYEIKKLEQENHYPR